jgi:hypothetical protein
MKTHAKNYKDTFIEIADDCPTTSTAIRLVNKVKIVLFIVITFLSFNSSFAHWTTIKRG